MPIMPPPRSTPASSGPLPSPDSPQSLRPRTGMGTAQTARPIASALRPTTHAEHGVRSASLPTASSSRMAPLLARSQSACQLPSPRPSGRRPLALRSRSHNESNRRWIKVQKADARMDVVARVPLPEAILALPSSSTMRLALAEQLSSMWERRVLDGLRYAVGHQWPDYARELGLDAETLATFVTALLSDQGYFQALTRWLARDFSEDLLMHRQALVHTRLDEAERHLNRLCTTLGDLTAQPSEPRVPRAQVAQLCQQLTTFEGLSPEETALRIDYVAAHLRPEDLRCLQAYLSTSEGSAYAEAWAQSAQERARFLSSEPVREGLSEMFAALQAPAAQPYAAPPEAR